MAGRSAREIRDELNRLMQEQIASLEKETFGGISQEELRQQEARLRRIREVSAEFLAALKRNDP
ncbi:MAG: hypothetical protein WA188_05080 [Terriglobales bacterium]